MNKKDLAIALFDCGVVQFGQFTLKSGLESPFYLDFRRIVGHPQIMKAVSELLWTLSEGKQFDHFCGVPYAALGIGATMSVLFQKPMLVKRKEQKKHGTKKLVEGVFEKGHKALVIDDVISSGISMVETLEALEKEGLVVEDVVAIVDRMQGGSQALAKKGYQVNCLYTLPELLNLLLETGKISQAQHQETLDFIQNNSISFEQLRRAFDAARPRLNKLRAESVHGMGQRLMDTMLQKKTNLCLSADVGSCAELLKLADLVGEHICMLKIHVDSLKGFDETFIPQLQALSKKHQFLIFEDRKFGDIGHIVQQQFQSLPYAISEWADVITVHTVAGGSTIEALKRTGKLKQTGVLLIAEMSTADTLTKDEYVEKSIEIAAQHLDVVIGIVGQNHRPKGLGQLLCTPGIHLEKGGDDLGQRYNTPRTVFERGTDVMIVGRGIYAAENPKAAAELYQKWGWEYFDDQLN